jgi:hypothetical protein
MGPRLAREARQAFGFCPEGAIGLSLGFQPQEQVHTTTRPEGAEDVWVEIVFFISVHLFNTDLPPLQGGRVFKPVPRVKTLG